MIVATAGHVDHGKTSLIKQLTGVDTDRLEEEKRRGLSINLGFAYRPMADGSVLGFIDVPGHRRFINTMIAGISGIDLGMLIVAADDGLMPQTYEHLNVLRLLGLGQYLLVVTKTDRVDAERVEQVSREACALLPATTSVYPVSNATGEGIAELRDALDALCLSSESQSTAGHFRLSLDRVFHLKGAGLVVTGTVASGSVQVGDSLYLQPQGRQLRVRSIHAQDRNAERGVRGQRCALNVSGAIEKSELERGDWLISQSDMQATTRFDARFEMLSSCPFALKHLAPVRLHIGAKRVAARLVLLNRESEKSRLDPGADALVQLMVDSPVLSCHGDRFLLRDDSESVTLGGGIVLDPLAPRSGKSQPGRLEWLAALELASVEASVASLVLQQNRVLTLATIKRTWNLRDDEADALLTLPLLSPLMQVEAEGDVYLLAEQYWRDAARTLIDGMQRFHEQQPAATGVAPAVIRKQLEQEFEAALFVPLLTQLLRDSKLALKDGLLQVSGRKVHRSEAEEKQWQRVEAIFHKRGQQIPLLSELVTETGLSKAEMETLLRRAARDGVLCKLNDTRYALPAEMKACSEIVQALAAKKGVLTVIEFRDALGCGRKLAIEVLEYFDSIRFTQRREQERVILDAALPEKLFSH